ncbi:MAG: type II toxin-antitoxin system Phd/YefM family antitoxin [Anaerolineae bacterium]
MPRIVSASEAKTKFGAIVDWAIETQDDVIVESHGQPRVVIVSYTQYQEILVLREQARRQDALQRLRKLRETVRARNQDLDEEQADALAVRFSRDIVTDMVAEEKIPYQDSDDDARPA